MFTAGLFGKTAILTKELTDAEGKVILEEDSPLTLSGNIKICIHRTSRKIIVQIGVRPLAAKLDTADIFVSQEDLLVM